MKKSLFFLSVLVLAIGCNRAPHDKEILARINNYEITKENFEEDFKESMHFSADTPQARREFLDNLIDRKLILQNAQAEGLDKEQGFLRMIEKFWEQSLLKISLDKKIKEISASVSVSDKEMRVLYEKMLKQGEISKPYEQAREQLKREIAKSKESQAINAWIAQLHEEAEIKINEELLGAKK